MVVQQQIGPIWTVEQYLVLERYSTATHEYHGGYVYAMAGGRLRHHPRYRRARRVVGRELVRRFDQVVFNSQRRISRCPTALPACLIAPFPRCRGWAAWCCHSPTCS